jgi:hypothetical protein
VLGEWKGVLQNQNAGLRSFRAQKRLSKVIMRNVYRYQGTLMHGGDRANTLRYPDMNLNVDNDGGTPQSVSHRRVRGATEKHDRLPL